MRAVKTVGIVGTGVIGAAWAARFLAHGLDVVAWDPAPNGEEQLRSKIDNAWPALTKVGLFPGADRSRARFVSSLEELAQSADFIQEAAPERMELKQDLYRDLDRMTAADVILASSTSGFMPSDLQAKCEVRPERLVIGHPFNPVYLLPLVEVVPGKAQDEAVMDAACEFYRTVGMYALRVRKEVDGHISDRLQEALWRENLHIINDGIASPKELDDAIIYGPGLRWAFMGVNKTFTLAGGDQGMKHFFQQFGPALELPWTHLKAPALTDELVDTMVEGCEPLLEGKTIQEMEQLRDDCLIDIMRALRTYQEGAGRVLHENEERRKKMQASS